ncbi:hypothetical protein PIB30_084754 [Stylosanthes scabra]|uniref:Uncharacterized protein n=1 Tax=Stylosanthes scabra TaxID=79078 RepID=A0ABU6XRP7_9FABA|nr:hypothetical protein [Stylosanthes scabra]
MKASPPERACQYRRDNKPLAVRGFSFREEVYASSSLDVGIDTEVVNGSEMDSAADLVILECSEYEKEEMRSGLIQDVLDEWSFSDFNHSVMSDGSVVEDQSAEWMAIYRHGDKEKEDKESNRSESKSSDRTVTWDYERKVSDENKVIILKKAVVESKGAMEQSGSLTANESVCSSGVRIFEAINEGFHDKQPDSKVKEEGANPMEMLSESLMGVQ